MSDLVLSLERFEAGEAVLLDRAALVEVMTGHGAEFDELGWATLRCADGGEAELSVSAFEELLEAVVYVEKLTVGLAEALFEAAAGGSLTITASGVPDAAPLVTSPGDVDDLPEGSARRRAVICWTPQDLHTMLRHAAGALAGDPLVPPVVEHPGETAVVDRADLLRQAFGRFRRS